MKKSTRTGRVSETIARRIKKAISEGRLGPGEKLPAERDMAGRLRASRVSVREAYRSLEEAGLLSIRRGAEGGAFIADFDPGPVSRSLTFMLRVGRTPYDQLTEARVLLEPSVARLAARRAAPDDLARLESLLRDEQAALRGQGDARCIHLDFHRLVAQCARNLPLAILTNSMADLAAEVAQHIRLDDDLHEHIVSFHARIFDSIRKHDEEEAHRLMLRHIRDVQGRLRRAYEANIRPARPAARPPRIAPQRTA